MSSLHGLDLLAGGTTIGYLNSMADTHLKLSEVVWHLEGPLTEACIN